MPADTALRAACDQLAAALEAMDPFTRIQFATETLRAGRVDSEHPPEARTFWLAIHSLTADASDERVEHLVSVVEVVAPRVRQAIASMAERAVDNDAPRAPVWRAIADVAHAVG